METFSRGQLIVAQGSTTCAIRQVVSGRVLVVSERDNKRLALGALRDGALFGELSFWYVLVSNIYISYISNIAFISLSINSTGVPATASVYAETDEVAVYVCTRRGCTPPSPWCQASARVSIATWPKLWLRVCVRRARWWRAR